MSQELKKKLKAAREKLGLTQAQAAKAWEVPLGTLICWENDQRTPSSLSFKLLNQMLDNILENGPASPFSRLEEQEPLPEILR